MTRRYHIESDGGSTHCYIGADAVRSEMVDIDVPTGALRVTAQTGSPDCAVLIDLSPDHLAIGAFRRDGKPTGRDETVQVFWGVIR